MIMLLVTTIFYVSWGGRTRQNKKSVSELFLIEEWDYWNRTENGRSTFGRYDLVPSFFNSAVFK